MAKDMEADRGFVVFTFDRRGFGRTALDPKKYRLGSKRCSRGKSHRAPVPHGPFYGGGLVLAFATRANTQDSVSQLSGIIATSPCLRLAKPLASIVRWLGSRVHAILPNQNIPASVEPKYLSHDPAVVKENEMDTRRSASLRAVDDMLTRTTKGGPLLSPSLDRAWNGRHDGAAMCGTRLGSRTTPSQKFSDYGDYDDLNFVNGYTLMGGTELVTTSSPYIPRHAHDAVALVVKAALTVVTFRHQGSAGIFIPTLGVGACAGRIVGLVVQYARWRWPTAPVFASCLEDFPMRDPRVVCDVGAAAALSGVTRTTVSHACCPGAKTVADALEPKGIYDLVIELSQLPYLNAKHQYLWGGLTVSDAMDRDVEAIHFGHSNTVCTCGTNLQRLLLQATDIGFPILRSDEDGRSRMLGFIGGNELEHALSIVAEEADHPVSFHPSRHLYRSLSSSSLSSILEHPEDPFDFSVYMDKTPLTISINSPLELIQQFFWQFALVSWEGWP
ncbi:hypothetical protein BJV78DRAFT_1285234 [Lactifluus subvellereus]|nr:hypothetical protein BJV78DRAFT_1285234 [Lactifluus subvellereus]